MTRQSSATRSRLGPRPLQVLEVLVDHPVSDRSGRAAQRLQFESGYDSRTALAQMLARLESAGLIHRDVRGRRTFRIEITEAGRRALRPEDTPTLAASANRDATFDVSGGEGMDYDMLAGVLLRTALRAIRAQEETPQGSETPARPGGRLDDGADRRRRIAKAEGRADAAEAALSDAKRRLFDLECENRILQRNNAKLQEKLEQAERVRREAINVRAMVSAEENQALESLRRELERMMVQPPAASG